MARGAIDLSVDLEATAKRAESMLLPTSPFIQYSMQQPGGKNPFARHPASEWRHPKLGTVLTSDCSGFAAWCAGYDRWQRGRLHVKGYDGWCETTTICLDARGEQSLFERLDRPMRGCFVVYPDRRVLGIKREGHIGVVIRVPWEWTDWKDVLVAHCHGPAMKGRAISVGTADRWMKRKDALLVRFKRPTA